jgi:RimJ/RimL family protein N-acetyltransferase
MSRLSSGELPPRRTSRVELRVVGREHSEYLWDLCTQPEILHRFGWSGSTPNPLEFERAIWDGVLVQFLIAKTSAPGDVAGLIQCINANWRHGTARLQAVLDPTSQHRIWPIEGFMLFVNYVFSTYPLRKLYGEVSEPNFEQFSSGAARNLFDVEGCLAEHEWHLGQYVDTYIVSMTRGRWEQNRATRSWQRLLRLESAAPAEPN